MFIAQQNRANDVLAGTASYHYIADNDDGPDYSDRWRLTNVFKSINNTGRPWTWFGETRFCERTEEVFYLTPVGVSGDWTWVRGDMF